MAGVLVLNADLSPLASVTWQRAVTLLLETEAKGVPTAFCHESDPQQSVRSPSVSVPFPRIIQLSRYVYVPYDDRGLLDVGHFATKRGILDRDKQTCVYCGKAGTTTVDHVLPRSRGGGSAWENLAACCTACKPKWPRHQVVILEVAGSSPVCHPDVVLSNWLAQRTVDPSPSGPAGSSPATTTEVPCPSGQGAGCNRVQVGSSPTEASNVWSHG